MSTPSVPSPPYSPLWPRRRPTPARNHDVEVESGLLICPVTGRWYPIRNFIPEVLPDHLRDLRQDFAFLRSIEHCLPPQLFAALYNETLFPERGLSDEGSNYKFSEIGITSKIDDPEFFGPGYLSPFNPSASEHTIYLLRLFGFCISLIEGVAGKTVLDTGCGYAWTTEWLMKAGFEAIGIDITRVYLEVGRARAGMFSPYMVIGDTENLPIRSDSIDAVLGFDSFHHIPDRKAAMVQFDRVLREGGRIVLGEPNGAHEQDAGSQAVMAKYGILERGMELADVRDYTAGTRLRHAEQIFPLRVPHDKLMTPLSAEFLAAHNWSPANLFRIERTAPPATAPVPGSAAGPRGGLLQAARRWLGGR